MLGRKNPDTTLNVLEYYIFYFFLNYSYLGIYETLKEIPFASVNSLKKFIKIYFKCGKF